MLKNWRSISQKSFAPRGSVRNPDGKTLHNAKGPVASIKERLKAQIRLGHGPRYLLPKRQFVNTGI